MIAMSVLSQGGPMGAFHRCEDCQEGEDDCGAGGYFAQISDSGHPPVLSPSVALQALNLRRC